MSAHGGITGAEEKTHVSETLSSLCYTSRGPWLNTAQMATHIFDSGYQTESRGILGADPALWLASP
jgi:hypothetical protein